MDHLNKFKVNPLCRQWLWTQRIPSMVLLTKAQLQNSSRLSQIHPMPHRLWRALTARILITLNRKCRDQHNKCPLDKLKIKTCLPLIVWRWSKLSSRPSGSESTLTTLENQELPKCVTRTETFQLLNKLLRKKIEPKNLLKFLKPCATLKLTIRCLSHP